MSDETKLIDVGDVEPSFDEDFSEGYANDGNDISDDIESQPRSGPEIAELKDRFAAFVIDAICLYALYWPILLIYRNVVFGKMAGPIPVYGINGLALNGLYVFACFLWFVLSEFAFQATLGKFLCHLQVRKVDGSSAGIISILVRNLIRPLDIILAPMLLSPAMMEMSGWHRRIGDMLAGTVVIRNFTSNRQEYSLSLDIIASATRRTLAFIFDAAIWGTFILGYALLITPKQPVFSMFLVVMFPPVILFAIFMSEYAFKTTPGKWIFGMRICLEDGMPLGVTEAVIRTIWRPLDMNPIGFMSVLLSTRKNRPGDAAAGSVVIKAKRSFRGLFCLITWGLFSLSVLYGGIHNENNLLNSDFQINFLPSISTRSTSTTPSDTAYRNLAIQNFQFSESSNGTPLRPPVYTTGETVYLNFDVLGYTIGNDNKAWLQEDLSIHYPDGSIGLKLDSINDFHQELDGSGPVQFENNIALPNNSQSGRYIVMITIHDRLSKRDMRERRFFYVNTSSNISKKNSTKKGDHAQSEESNHISEIGNKKTTAPIKKGIGFY